MYSFIVCFADNAALFTTVVVANYMRRIFFGLTGSSNSGGAMSLSIQDNAFIWVLPAILAALPFTTGHYGYNDDDIFCWIEGVGEGGNDHMRDAFSLLWQGLVVGIPAAIGICYNFWVYYSILKNVKAWKNVRTLCICGSFEYYCTKSLHPCLFFIFVTDFWVQSS